MKFLVTAGNTREPIDLVRDWGNIFTGNTGWAIAKALTRYGTVDLVTSNQAHLAALTETPAGAEGQRGIPGVGGVPGVRGIGFATHADLERILGQLVPGGEYGAIFMTAAVADYQPARVYEVLDRQPGAAGGEEFWKVRDVQAGKVRSTYREIAVLGVPTRKIVDQFRTAWGFRGLLVKFKLEVGLTPEQLRTVGRASRRASGADYLVANTLAMVSGPDAGAWLIGAEEERWVLRAELAEQLANLGNGEGGIRTREAGLYPT